MKISHFLKGLTGLATVSVATVPLTACAVNGGGSEVTNNPDNTNPETETPDTESPDEIVPEEETPDGQNKAKYCKIKFSSEGFPTGTTMSGSTTTSVRNGKYFSTVKKPTVTCPKGYKCSGWSEDAPTAETRTLMKDNNKIESDKTLYGVFEQVTTTHTVTLFAGDGYFTGNKKIISVTVNDKDTLKDIFEYPKANERIALPTLKDIEDGQFDKWVTADGSSEFTNDTEITEDVALCAKYTTTLWAPTRTDNYTGCVGIINSSSQPASISISRQPNSPIYYQKNTIAEGTWSGLPLSKGTPITLSKGEWIHLRSQGSNTEITSTIKIEGGSCTLNGNVMGLLDNGKGTKESISTSQCFLNLFKESNGICLVSKNFLQATTLADYCYESMFEGCINLKNAPDLPATTIEGVSYSKMFKDCTSLTKPPVISANKCSSSSCSSMFEGCTSLETPPEINITNTERSCYRSMFKNCTSLTTSPELPATTLADYCYESMFEGCTSLTTAPELPATKLEYDCYNCMFYGCSTLKNASINLDVTDLEQDCFFQMFYNCSSLTTVNGYTINENWFMNMNFWNNNKTHNFNNDWCYAMFGGDLDDNGNPLGPYDIYLKNSGLSCPFTLPTITKYPSLQQACFSGLNACCRLIKTVDENYLPWEITTCCYRRMFENCTSLKSGPKLIFSNTLHWDCLYKMFYNCSSLTEVSGYEIKEDWFYRMKFWEFENYFSTQWCYAMFGGDLDDNGNPLGPYDIYLKNSGLSCPFTLPSNTEYTSLTPHCFSGLNACCRLIKTVDENYLPWTTLAEGCYEYMFYSCDSLETSPKLSSLIACKSCYKEMFYECTSLNKAPEISLTTLDEYCCYYMFAYCSSLATPPSLTSAELKYECYYGMFYRCGSLKINNDGTSGTLFFTCPETTSTLYAVSIMFCYTGGTYTSDPVANGTYYWY